MADPSCGAWQITTRWNLGYGSANTPRVGALLVVDRWDGNPAGHVAIVRSVQRQAEGVYAIVADDSNAHGDGRVYTNVACVADTNAGTVTREGWRPRGLRGFVQVSAWWWPSPIDLNDAFARRCVAKYQSFFGSALSSLVYNKFRWVWTSNSIWLAVPANQDPLTVHFYKCGTWYGFQATACY